MVGNGGEAATKRTPAPWHKYDHADGDDVGGGFALLCGGLCVCVCKCICEEEEEERDERRSTFEREGVVICEGAIMVFAACPYC